MNTPPPTWHPAGASGVSLGLTISVLALACALILLITGAVTSSAATRLVCMVGTAISLAILVGALVGTWWCATLQYVLDDTALEIRFGAHATRLGYGAIEGVTGRSAEPHAAPTLWPGAHFGRVDRPDGRTEVWWASTRDPRRAVVVLAGNADAVLTPAEPTAIRTTLISNARQAEYVEPTGLGLPLTWLDYVASVDGWVRAVLFGAIVVATLGIAADGLRFGALQADGLKAAAILLANAIVALAVARRWPVFGRLLAAGALAGQAVALV
jgi:hypothetical protein